MTSTIGALHRGHLPPPRTNSFAHFKQVHMWPHLQDTSPRNNQSQYEGQCEAEVKEVECLPPPKFGGFRAIFRQMLITIMNSEHWDIVFYLYNKESIWLSQHTQQVPFLTCPHLDPSSEVSATAQNIQKHNCPSLVYANWNHQFATHKKQETTQYSLRTG